MNKKLFGAGAALAVAGLVLLGVVAANQHDKDDNATIGSVAPQTQQPSPQTATAQSQTPSDSMATPNNAAVNAAVEIQDMAYSHAAITVKKGTTVTWTNRDSVQHTVTMDEGQNGGPDSELQGTGGQYNFTFDATGTYTYHCAPHPNMKATVIVTG